MVQRKAIADVFTVKRLGGDSLAVRAQPLISGQMPPGTRVCCSQPPRAQPPKGRHNQNHSGEGVPPQVVTACCCLPTQNATNIRMSKQNQVNLHHRAEFLRGLSLRRHAALTLGRVEIEKCVHLSKHSSGETRTHSPYTNFPASNSEAMLFTHS